jgi:hypothetical protein
MRPRWMARSPATSSKRYRWESWAAPKGKDGKLDHNKALTGDDDFVSQKLFPYLHGFKQRASGPNTIGRSGQGVRGVWSGEDRGIYSGRLVGAGAVRVNANGNVPLPGSGLAAPAL